MDTVITVSDFKFLMKEVAKDVRVEFRHTGFDTLEYSLVVSLDGEELLRLPVLRESPSGEQFELISIKEEGK